MNQNKLRLQNLDKMCCMLMKDIGESYAIPADLKDYQFLEHASERRTVLLELGVGFNTPSIIRFPFERMTAAWKNTHLVRINQENAQSMLDNSRTIAIRKDISEVLLHRSESVDYLYNVT